MSRVTAARVRHSGRGAGWLVRAVLIALLPGALALSGCSGWIAAANNANAAISSNAVFSISPGVLAVDTNCTGCNHGKTEWLGATLATGSNADVSWSLDPSTNFGSIDSSTGLYTPPAYLSADGLEVRVTAALKSNPNERASATITVTPGFLQPLSPENFAVGAGGSIQVTGFIAEAGGTAGIAFKLADTPNGTGAGQGTLGTPECTRSKEAFTFCTVAYTAPATVTRPGAVYIVASAGGAQAKEAALVLLNTEGVESSPAGHQQQTGTAIALGSSGGNNNDYDTRNGNIVDCCSGTLGALVQNSSGTQYLLSNNHVLARTDQASVGEAIVQPGLIDSSCTPYPAGKVTPVGVLTGWVPIKSPATNVDAAIAQVNSGAVNESGSILELGARQSNGSLMAAPPGVSSSGGRGEGALLNMSVAKSGRTTGLTCASVSALNLDIKVSYFSDCAETHPYFTKTYTNQIGIAGSQFSDAGDSGALVVDAGNAEPVGLFFAGGQDALGVGQGVANPAGEVLSELSSNVGNGVAYSFVGGADHPVSCLNYDAGATSATHTAPLRDFEQSRGELALAQARMLVSPSTGVYGVALGKSGDRAGEAAVVVYVDPNGKASIPATVYGVRTVVIPASMQAVAAGAAPQFPAESGVLTAQSLRVAIGIKQQIAASLMKRNSAFFGVGVGESFDNPKEAALVVYVDRGQVPARLPATIRGLRVRYIVMDRLHVTRAYLSGTEARSHCVPHPAETSVLDLLNGRRLRELRLF